MESRPSKARHTLTCRREEQWWLCKHKIPCRPFSVLHRGCTAPRALTGWPWEQDPFLCLFVPIQYKSRPLSPFPSCSPSSPGHLPGPPSSHLQVSGLPSSFLSGIFISKAKFPNDFEAMMRLFWDDKTPWKSYRDRSLAQGQS